MSPFLPTFSIPDLCGLPRWARRCLTLRPGPCCSVRPPPPAQSGL